MMDTVGPQIQEGSMNPKGHQIKGLVFGALIDKGVRFNIELFPLIKYTLLSLAWPEELCKYDWDVLYKKFDIELLAPVQENLSMYTNKKYRSNRYQTKNACIVPRFV